MIDAPSSTAIPDSASRWRERWASLRATFAGWIARVGTGIERLRDGRYRERLRRMSQVGRLTGVGLVLLTTSAVLWFSTVAPMREAVASLREDVRLQQARVTAAGGAPKSLDAQARAFIRRLPARDELPVVLATIVAQAKAAGLVLERGDYEFTMAKSGQIARYRVNLPVSGTYVQIQNFVDGTLAALPPVALQGLKIERDSVGEKQLQANLQFAVMVRSGQ